MKTFKFVCLFFLCSNFLIGQSVQWASKVVKVSSEYPDDLFSAKQVIGIPNSVKGYADCQFSWAAKRENGGQEFIHVAFDYPIHVQQFAIIESLNPGAITKVELYETNGKSHKVYEKQKPRHTYRISRMFTQKIPRTKYKVIGLRVTLNTSAIQGFNFLDAIAISDSDRRITVEIDSLVYEDDVDYPENLGKLVNSQYSERLPIISPDGQTLYYTRKYHPENMGEKNKDDIWVSKYGRDGKWRMAANIGPPLNNDRHNFVIAVSPNNRYIYLGSSYKNWEKDGVAIAKIKGDKWGTPKTLKIANMYNRNKFAGYHVDVTGSILLMAIERDDTYGDRDLYVSFRNGNEWSEPMNLGPVVNSVGMESSVFLAADNRTLYFSSSGFPGYGGLDMYMVRRLDDSWTNWTSPKNLGSEINTPGNDYNYTIPASGDYAYYSSDYRSYGKSDLFRIRLPQEARPEPVPLVTLVEQGYSEEGDAPYVYQPPSTPTNADPSLDALREKYKRSTTETPNTPTPPNVPSSYSQPEDPELAKLREKYNKTKEEPKPTRPVRQPTKPTVKDDELAALKRKYQKATEKEQPKPPKTGGFVTATEVYDEPIVSTPKKESEPTNGGFETETIVYGEPTPETPETPEVPSTDPPTAGGFITETTIYQQPTESETPQKTREELENELRDEVRAQLRSELLDDVATELEDELEGDVKANLKDNLKDDVAKELEKELRNEVRNDLKDDLKDDVAKELEDELRKEVIASLRDELYNDVKKELRQTLEDRIRDELEYKIRKELEAEIRKELEAEQAKEKISSTTPNPNDKPKDKDSWMTGNVEVGQIIPMDRIFFEVNKATLKQESFEQLGAILSFLESNQKLIIEVGGHSNGLATNEYAVELSQGRAKAVADYLVAQGIPKKRIQYHGYGKSHPIASNGTAVGRKKNQRVELKILEIVD